MIIVRLRIIFDKDLNFFDTYLKFEGAKNLNSHLNLIKKNLNLKLLDFCEVKKSEYSDYFKEKFNKKNQYYIILLTI